MAEKKLKLKSFPDLYISIPLFFDFILVGAIIGIVDYYIKCINYTESNINESTSTIIDNSVSLAGFILAALTIIASFRGSIMDKLMEAEAEGKRKEYEKKLNGLQILMAGDNYHEIIKVFKGSIFELLLCFSLLSFFYVFRESLVDKWRYYAVITGYSLTLLSIFRSIAVLFRILIVEKKQTTQKKHE